MEIVLPGWAVTLVAAALAFAWGRSAGARAERERARAAPLHFDSGLVASALAEGEDEVPRGEGG